MNSARAWLLLISLGLPIATFAATPPPNDYFTNATVLTGDDLTFTGTLDGATLTGFEVANWQEGAGDAAVWWSWTAGSDQPVTIFPVNRPVRIVWGDALLVYNQEPLDDYTYASDALVASIHLQTASIYPSLTFVPVPGHRYWLKWRGFQRQSMDFRLIATNSPILLEHPSSQTVAPDSAALFKVVATGLRPFAYQWHFNGVDLPGANLAMLSLSNLTATHAGEYSVTVSNSTGVATSDVATLVVTNIETAPRLEGATWLNPTKLLFSMEAEPGRRYRIESSSNMVAWLPEKTFPIHPEQLSCDVLTSVLVTSNTVTSFAISNSLTQKFLRAVSYRAPDELCNLSLKRIRFAKELWDSTRSPASDSESVPQTAELAPYLGFGVPEIYYWQCPAGGYFMVNELKRLPACTIHGDLLEEPR